MIGTGQSICYGYTEVFVRDCCFKILVVHSRVVIKQKQIEIIFLMFLTPRILPDDKKTLETKREDAIFISRDMAQSSQYLEFETIYCIQLKTICYCPENTVF